MFYPNTVWNPQLQQPKKLENSLWQKTEAASLLNQNLSFFTYVHIHQYYKYLLQVVVRQIDTFLVKQEGTRSENTLVSLQSFASWQLWTQTCCGGPGRHQAPNRLKLQSENQQSFFAHFGVLGPEIHLPPCCGQSINRRIKPIQNRTTSIFASWVS